MLLCLVGGRGEWPLELCLVGTFLCLDVTGIFPMWLVIVSADVLFIYCLLHCFYFVVTFYPVCAEKCNSPGPAGSLPLMSDYL